MELGEHVDIGCNEAKLNIVFHSPFLKIKQKGYKKYDNIILATLDINDKVVVYEKNEQLKAKDVME